MKRCIICEDNENMSTVASSECSDYCQEVDERNSGEEDLQNVVDK